MHHLAEVKSVAHQLRTYYNGIFGILIKWTIYDSSQGSNEKAVFKPMQDISFYTYLVQVVFLIRVVTYVLNDLSIRSAAVYYFLSSQIQTNSVWRFSSIGLLLRSPALQIIFQRIVRLNLKP